MEETIQQFLEGLELGPLAVCLLFLAAGIEYICPPFPGDSVVLMGAFLVGARGWNPVVVYGALNMGSVGGMILSHRFGLYMRHRDPKWREKYRLWTRVAPSLDRVMPFFIRHAALYLSLNRFLPSIRALFFIAAGMARVPLYKVLIYGGLSALAWNALLLVIGSAIGDNWEKLVALFSRYNKMAWGVVIFFLVLWLLWFVWRRKNHDSRD